MKSPKLVVAIIALVGSIHVSNAQWSLSGNSVTSGQFLGTTNNVLLEFRRNNAQVLSFDEHNNINLGQNNSITLDFTNSAAIGNNIGLYNQDQVENTFVIGSNILSYGGFNQGAGTSSITIGSGVSSSARLFTDREGLLVGFNSTIPTFYVGISNGVGTTGNVGIATLNPLEKLDVVGAIKLGTTTTANAGTIRYTGSDFEGYSGGQWKSLTATYDGVQRGAPIYFLGGPDDPNYLIQSGAWDDGMKYKHFTSHKFYTGFSVERMRLTSAGNLGIGLTNPLIRLSLGLSPVAGGADGIQLRSNETVYAELVATGSSYNNFGVGSNQIWLNSQGGDLNLGPATQHNIKFVNNGGERMRIASNGGVAVGTTCIPAGYILAVKGNIICEGVKIKLNGGNCWADYVFANDYKLMPLGEVEKYIKQNQHLPDVPSAAEVEKEGIGMMEMNATLLRKIEELTLYTIELQKQVNELQKLTNEKNGK